MRIYNYTRIQLRSWFASPQHLSLVPKFPSRSENHLLDNILLYSLQMEVVCCIYSRFSMQNKQFIVLPRLESQNIESCIIQKSPSFFLNSRHHKWTTPDILIILRNFPLKTLTFNCEMLIKSRVMDTQALCLYTILSSLYKIS